MSGLRILYSVLVNTTYSITRAQSQLPGLVRETAKSGAIAITRHDETVAYLISADRMEAIAETMEVLANPDAMRALRDYEAGQTRMHPLAAIDDEG